MQQQTAPQPSRAALGVVQLRDSLGDGGDIRRSEGAGAAAVPVLLILATPATWRAFGTMQQQTAPQPSRAALGVVQLRDGLGDGQEIRPPEGKR